MRHPFVGLALAAIIGIIAADFCPVLTTAMLVIAVAAAVLALRWPFTPLLYALVPVTFFVLHSARTSNTAGQKLAERAGIEECAADLTGVVATEPKVESDGNATFILQCREAKLEGEPFATNASVFVHWRGRPQIGDTLELFGTLQPIPPPRNPGEFDMPAFLKRRDITRLFIVRYPENARVISHDNGFSLIRTAARAREWMQTVLSLDLENSPDVIGLICGTALGLRHQTRDDIEEPFQQTGTLHLFAVAGLHVGIVARLLWTVAIVLRLPRKAGTALIIPLLFFYAAVTGLHTASVRAAVMSALLLAGIFFDRKVLALNSLAAAAFIILLADSNQLFTSGFQLSFCVVGAIVLLADPLYLRLRTIAQPDPFLPRRLLSRVRGFSIAVGNAIARGASVSLAAWVGSLPLIYWYFHLVTPVSLFANLAIVPIAYFVLALALLSILCAPISTGLSIIFNNANWLMSRLVLALVHCFAAIPFGHIYLPPLTNLSDDTVITVLDEGIGGAAHVRANSYNWLIDCGPQRTYERTLKALLHFRGVNGLEGMILTHGDAQHLGGAAGAILDFQPLELYDNPLEVRSAVRRHILAALRLSKITARPLVRGDQLLLGRDVHASVLYPPRNQQVASADDAPLILRIIFDEKLFVLFESDAGAEAEATLLKSSEPLRSDILIKGQHHAGNSGTMPFVEAVAPKLIIATSREMPVTENITPEWAKEIAQRGIQLFRQDQTGAVEIRLTNKNWTARGFLNRQLFEAKVDESVMREP